MGKIPFTYSTIKTECIPIGVRVFKTIGEDTWPHHPWSINNIVNYMAVPMVYDEIAFDF